MKKESEESIAAPLVDGINGMLSEWDKKDDEWKKRYGFTFTYFAWWCHVAMMAIPLLFLLIMTIMGVDGYRPYGQNTGDKVRNHSCVINNTIK